MDASLFTGWRLRHVGQFFTFTCIALLAFSNGAMSAPKKPGTVAELALYQGADRQQLLEEGAKREGKLTFYTTGILQQGVRPVVAGFEKKYPYLKVDIWRSGADTLLPRMLEEHKSGKDLADVIESAQLVHFMLQKAGAVQPFLSPALAIIEEGAMKKAPGEGYLAVGFRESGIGLGYNTKQIAQKDLPKTYQDLLDPKWKGKLAIAGSETGPSWMGTMLATFGEDLVKRMAQQKFDVHMVSAMGLLDMVINGEYQFSPTIFESHVINSKRKGAPVDWLPLEPVYVNLGQIGLTKQPPHPHAALLFIDFQLSQESAAINKAAGYLSTRKDVQGTATYKKRYGLTSAEEGAKWSEMFSLLFVKR